MSYDNHVVVHLANLPSSNTKHIVTDYLSDNTTQDASVPWSLALNAPQAKDSRNQDDIVVMTKASDHYLCSALWHYSLHCLQLFSSELQHLETDTVVSHSPLPSGG
jgi:hypothetical protein